MGEAVLTLFARRSDVQAPNGSIVVACWCCDNQTTAVLPIPWLDQRPRSNLRNKFVAWGSTVQRLRHREAAVVFQGTCKDTQSLSFCAAC